MVVKTFQYLFTLPNLIPDFSRGKINLEFSSASSMQHVGFGHQLYQDDVEKTNPSANP